MMHPVLRSVAEAIEEAKCPGREGPYGLYDYSSYGWPKPHRVRDFRLASSRGEDVFTSDEREAAEAEFKRLTQEHMAKAAIKALISAGFAIVPYCCEPIILAAGWSAINAGRKQAVDMAPGPALAEAWPAMVRAGNLFRGLDDV